MNFSKRDLFGDDDSEPEDSENPQPQPQTQQIDEEKASSSSSSSSASSSSNGGSSSSGSASRSGSGNASSSDDDDEVQQMVDDDNGKDLFGSDNEEYINTPANSPFPIPPLPLNPMRNNNNNNNNNSVKGNYRGGGRSQSNGRGNGILPSPPNSRQRGGYGGYGRQNFARQDERFVDELKFLKTEETLSRKAIAFQEPSEVACYSRVESGEVFFDDRSLRLFKRLISEDVGADLNEGFDNFIAKRDLGSEGFGDLLAAIRNKRIPLQNIHFVTFRNNLNKILATAYLKHEKWEMGVHKRNGVVYLDVHTLPERPQTEFDRRRCYWGYSFENLATEDSARLDLEGTHHIDSNVEFCSVVKTKLGAHRIIMGAEMDCCDSHEDGRRFYIELKTSRELDHRTEERFEREKLLKFWIQSFLAGVPFIVVGYRDDNGVLVRTERLRTKDITHRVKMKNYWQGGVCLAFADEVLCWLYGTVNENEDYILQFAANSNRIELLRAASCPEAITNHVQHLQLP